MPYEEVIVNIYGDKAWQWVNDPAWQAEFERYKAAYEAAPDKSKFNAEWFKNAN